jgi:Domain of unknown function (DUF3291)
VTGDERFHLAQVNIAMPSAPLDSDQLAEFMALLSPINALADDSPGFVWRLQTEDGDATAVRAFGDDRLIVNMSVWASLEALGDFVYRSAHTVVMRRRREWFHPMPESFTALWWIPAETVPTIGDAEERLGHLRQHGSSPLAFTFREPFPPPGSADGAHLGSDDRWLCPT